MSPVFVSNEHIQITQDVCGGKPRIAGTRIRVRDVVVRHGPMGQSPEEFVAPFPHISLSDVHAALAYDYDHENEIHDLLRREDEIAAALSAEQPSIIDKISSRSDVAGESHSISSRRKLGRLENLREVDRSKSPRRCYPQNQRPADPVLRNRRHG